MAHNNVVRDCIAMDNLAYGIHVRDDNNVIVGNACNVNGAAGIFVEGDGNRIEGNQLCRNGYGLVLTYVDPDRLAQRNIAVKNTAYGNSPLDYFPGVSNAVAPIEASGSATFSNPWSNFEL